MTSLPRLAANVGTAAAQQARELVVQGGQQWLDVGESRWDAVQVAQAVRAELARTAYAGVVLVGGLDAVPADRLSVLDPELRRRVEELNRRTGGRGDSDDFIVWNDDLYGDRDGDGLPELPVSRIPDGRSAELLLRQLGASQASSGLTTGVRNLDRPFAERVFQRASGETGQLLVSDPTTPADLGRDKLRGSLYFMLHGRDTDSTRYWGEDDAGETVEAVHLRNVPTTLAGATVFLGCCWGGLTVLPRASRYRPGDPLEPKNEQNSLALAFLRNGANAVLGCTGTHYSPDLEPYGYFGQPMHDGFWGAVRGGSPPARALFEAKQQYARDLPHGQTGVLNEAVELKICRQFTCLGLGW